MTKPTFIFFGGLGWAGTTSLYYTLLYSEYMHGGAEKELPYLSTVFRDHSESSSIALPETKDYIIKQYTHLFYFFYEYLKNIKESNLYFILSYTELLNNIKIRLEKTKEIFLSESNFSCLIHESISKSVYDSKWNMDMGNPKEKIIQGFKPANQNPALAKFTPEDIEEFFPTSVDKYSTYYQKLWKYCQETNSPFKAVGDFANIKHSYSYDQLKQVKEALDPYFNVKAIQIFRDPLRRAFSCSSARIVAKREASPTAKTDEIFEGSNSFGSYSISNDYAEMITTWRNVFGKDNYHYVIMEDFFDPNQDEEREKLEKFLDHKIPKDKIFPCAFVPDKGINPPKIPGVKDQWRSDIVEFTPELYMINRHTICSKVYRNFKKLHGYLPSNWGKPIDYGYDD